MAETEFKNSLKNQMLKMTLVPLLLMTIIIVTVSTFVIRHSTLSQVHKELKRDAAMAILIYDRVYSGELNLQTSEETGEKELFKGEEKLSGDGIMLDDLASILDINISFFLNDTRVITTLVDENGKRPIGVNASAKIRKEVLEAGEAKFYSRVDIYGQESYVYYQPLTLENGTVYGMVGVSRSAAGVMADTLSDVVPIALCCALIALLIGFIMVRYNSRLGERISKMDRFMNKMSGGDFDAEIPRDLTLADDEIKRLAQDGKKMARAIKQLVEYDALTDIYNRRYAERTMESMREDFKVTGAQLCVSIGDIDFFKKVNDTYGHEVGDIVLKEVAAVLKKRMATEGFAARWGGEEFLLVFKNKSLEDSAELLESIMEDIRLIKIPGTNKCLAMSFGLTLMSMEEPVDESLKRADNNLYEAKESGRNRIVVK